MVLENDGLFLMVAKHLGIAHPQVIRSSLASSPIYAVALGTDAFRGHGQRVSRALACGVLFGCAHSWGFGGAALAEPGPLEHPTLLVTAMLLKSTHSMLCSSLPPIY